MSAEVKKSFTSYIAQQAAMRRFNRSNLSGVLLTATYGSRTMHRFIPEGNRDGNPYYWHVSDAYYSLEGSFNTKWVSNIEWTWLTSASDTETMEKVNQHLRVLTAGQGGSFNPDDQRFVMSPVEWQLMMDDNPEFAAIYTKFWHGKPN